MLTQDQARDIFRKVRRYATTDEVEVIVGAGSNSLTRFANNSIHQNVSDENLAVSVRTVFRDAKGAKTARASTNKVDDESLRRTVQAAEAISRVQHSDDDVLPMLASQDIEEDPTQKLPSRWFDATRAVGPVERAETVGKMVEVAKRHQLTTAGIVVINAGAEALFNSRGVERFHSQTNAEVSITMLGEDSSGWQKANSPDVRQLDPVKLAEVAAEKARLSAKPRELEPGRYTVILEPAAVLDLVGFMFYDFSGLAVLDQRSFLNERLGTKLFGENITIHDDVGHPLQAGASFDGEGVPRERVTLVDRGVARNLVYARATAAKMSASELAGKTGPVKPTGHGFALPNEVGEAPTNIVFENTGEASSVEEMIASTERGILVTRLWYIREVEPYEKILTGMTRDGTFLVENGRVKGGVRNFRFNQGLVEMLNHVELLGKPVRASGEEAFDMVVPAMKVSGFNFTEVTRF
jgi:PmbA protein